MVRLLDEGLVMPTSSLMALRYRDETERMWGKGQQQMGKLITAQGFISENLRKYVKVTLL